MSKKRRNKQHKKFIAFFLTKRVEPSNLKGYYQLIPYQVSAPISSVADDYTFFTTLIRRIFSCLRSHSKDAPARKTDFIDNRIISQNDYKKAF